MTRAFLGLGSNLGERERFLAEAVERLRGAGLTAVSPTYETEPVEGPDEQGPYLNLVVEIDWDRSPRELLELAHQLEAVAGRVRTERWGPRTLDVDILWIEGVKVRDPDLSVPHPRMWKRKFVLVPLRELAPELVSEEQVAAAAGEVWPIGEK